MGPGSLWALETVTEIMYIYICIDFAALFMYILSMYIYIYIYVYMYPGLCGHCRLRRPHRVGRLAARLGAPVYIYIYIYIERERLID